MIMIWLWLYMRRFGLGIIGLVLEGDEQPLAIAVSSKRRLEKWGILINRFNSTLEWFFHLKTAFYVASELQKEQKIPHLSYSQCHTQQFSFSATLSIVMVARYWSGNLAQPFFFVVFLCFFFANGVGDTLVLGSLSASGVDGAQETRKNDLTFLCSPCFFFVYFTLNL